MRKKSLLLILCYFLYPLQISAQISVSNQLEYSYWDEHNRNILENWLDLLYQQKQYTFGLRYEVNQPPDPFIFPLDSLLKQEELTIKFAEMTQGNFRLRVGNYYAMFGRGLTLRTYEERNLRVDNNIEGLKANFYSDHFEITALGGKMRDKYNRRQDRLYGLDGGINVGSIKAGASFLHSQVTDDNYAEIKSFRINPTFGAFDLYGELAKPSSTGKLSHYSSLTFSHERISLLAEYKDYHRLTFATCMGTEYNAPPALSREHSYTLLNRHPHVLNANDERGFQLESTVELFHNTSLLLNWSYTENHNNIRIFEEYYGQLTADPAEAWHLEGVLGWNYDFTTHTRNITPIMMAEYSWSAINQLHLEYQHQHVTSEVDNSEYDNELVLLEYSRAPNLNVALVGEYSNRYQLINVLEEQKVWLYGQVTFSFLASQQISILYGSRQAGFVCAGGVCRFEPEFKGVEIKLSSRF